MIYRITKYFLIFFVLYIALGHLYVYFTGDFREGNILTEGPPFTVSSSEIDPNPILDQKYFYLDSGNQVFALVSEDGKYVLKLFKSQTLQRSPLIHIFPAIFPFKQFLVRSKEDEVLKRDRIFVGYQLAYDHDRENTGLIYMHLTPKAGLLPRVHTVDAIGESRMIDLNIVPFVLQSKAIITRQVLKECLDKGDHKLAQQKIDQIFALYIDEYKKGIVDLDHNALDNTGFVGDKAVRIDIGKLIYDERFKNPEIYEKDLDKVKKRLEDWMTKH